MEKGLTHAAAMKVSQEYIAHNYVWPLFLQSGAFPISL